MPTSRFHPAAVIVLALGALLAAPAALAVTFMVNSVADLPDDLTMPLGTCHTSAGTCTLRAAIMQANRTSGAGATIILPAGPPYVLNIQADGADGEENGDLNLTTPTALQGNPVITIMGAGTATTIIDGNQLDRVLTVELGRTVILSGVTIRNGFTAGFGGGIYNYGTLTLDDAVVHSNVSGARGGGIYSIGPLTLSNTLVGQMNIAGDEGGGVWAGDDLHVFNSTISHNQATGNGGGLWAGGAAYLVDSTIDGNHAHDGGGVYTNGNLTMTNSRLSQNQAVSFGGGAQLASFTATSDLTDSTIDGNSAAYGGGISSSSFLTLTKSTIKQNTASASGGGIFGEHHTTVTESTISQNHAGVNGGGVRDEGFLIVKNSTIVLNNANGDGGGIYNSFGGDANVYNTSIVFNGADFDQNGGAGGGVFNDSDASFNLRNSIIAGNDVGNTPVYDECFGTLTSYGRNLFGADHACTVNIGSGGFANLNSFSLLGPLQNNGGPTLTVALLPGSNAIDFGDPVLGCIDNNSLPITTDQRGQPRVVGAACDVGAYEYSALAPPVLVSAASRKVHGVAGTFDLPLASTPLNPTTEPRSGGVGGNHTMVFTFDQPLASGLAVIGAGTAVVGAPTYVGNEMRVPLSGVTNMQYVTVNVSNVVGSGGGSGGAGSVRVGFLEGDVNQNRIVSLADLGAVNAQLAQSVSAANFLRDINASGTLTLTDKAITNAGLTKALPPP